MGRTAEKPIFVKNRRHERRRRVEYLLNEEKESIIRKPIDDQTMICLLDSLEKGSVGQFGLLKLSSLKVDTIFPTPAQYLLFPFQFTTLCELAAWRGQDAVVGNLLRSGADPSISLAHRDKIDNNLPQEENSLVRTALDEVECLLSKTDFPMLNKWAKQAIFKCTQSEALSSLYDLKLEIEANTISSFSPSTSLIASLNQRAFTLRAIHDVPAGCMTPEERQVLSRLQPPYQVWIVRKIVSMRVNGPSLDVTCQNCGDQPALLTWANDCCHYICERCIWHNLTPGKDRTAGIHDKQAEETEEANYFHGYRLRCPCCGSFCEDDQDEVDSSVYSTDDITELKKMSMKKFLQLPETVSDLTPKMKAKDKGKFRALSFHQVAGYFMGSVQTIRTSALFRAVEQGDVARQRALFGAGVNLDARNEYGQTCAHVAAFFDDAPSLHFLISHGADLRMVANDDSDVAGVVASRNHSGCVQTLQLYFRQHPSLSVNMFEDDISHFSLQAKYSTLEAIKTHVLIPFESDHKGAGSRIIDNAFDDTFLDKLTDLWSRMPLAPPEKASCNERAYFCDTQGWVINALREVLEQSNATTGASTPSHAMPHIRFVNYPSEGGLLAPHIDLSRCHHKKPTLRSSYTFLLYLSNCDVGGETALLEHLPSIESSSPVIAAVKPKKGRLLLFPHACPHEGCSVVSCPKLFLRGEFY